VHIETYVCDPTLMTRTTVCYYALLFAIKHFNDGGFATGRDEPTARTKSYGKYRAEITFETAIDKSRNSENIFFATVATIAANATFSAIFISFPPSSCDIDDAYDTISAANA